MGNCGSSAPAGGISTVALPEQRAARYAAATAKGASSTSADSDAASSPLLRFDYRHAGPVSDICAGFSAFEVLSAGGGEGGTIQVVGHSLRTGKKLRTWAGHERAITRISAARNPPSGKRLLASASRDLTVRLWEVGAGAEGGQGQGEGQEETSTSGAGAAPSAPNPMVLRGHEFSVTAISLTEDAGLLASGSRDTTVRLWDVSRGSCTYTAPRSQNVVTCLKWYPGAGTDAAQNVFLQGGEDLKVRVWDTRAGLREAQTLDGYVYFPVRWNRG
jgi:WD40 repeat protein